MAYTFSTDQLSIIESRNQNILVSAAAGSGKTSVLTERIVQLVSNADNPVDIDRILVVTFTNAAAKEMKERIGARLNDMLLEHPDNVHLQRQAQLIYNAQITTIDSYCLYLLKNHFHKIGVDPVFRVASENEMKLLKADVLSEVIKRAYERKDKDFYHTVDCYSRKDNDTTLEESIIDLYTFAMSYPDPKGWLQRCRKDYSFSNIDEFLEAGYVKAFVNAVYDDVLKIEELLIKGRNLANMEDGPKGYIKTSDSDYSSLALLIEAAKKDDINKENSDKEKFDAICHLVQGVTFERIANPTKNIDPSLNEEFKLIRDRYKKIFESVKERTVYNLDTLYNDTINSAIVVNTLIDLVTEFIDSFSEAKRERSVIDFTDMEHMAIDILTDRINEDGTYEISDVARDLREYYKEVMVDEYQDSNLVQETIIQSVSKENETSGRNRFMVGDVKQSIYRFRLARPDIFTGKTHKYNKDAESDNRLITLKQNYRSRDSVIDSVNAIFENIMTTDRGGIEYDADARLVRAGEFTEDTDDNKTEVILLDAGKLNKSDFNPYEADAIALKIKELVGKMMVTDKKTKELRPAQYKDIAVLLRSPSGWRNYIKDSFAKLGIPYHMEGVGAFYDTREIRDILSFLQVIDNPLDDIAVYASMTSCFGHFSDEECAAIKAEDAGKHYYLWDKFKEYHHNHPDDDKCVKFTELVNKYRKLVTYMPISELITRLFEETGYKYIVSALPDGKQRLANVNLLVLKAAEYAGTSFHGLFHFMRYIELIRKTDQDEGEANIFDEDADAVRVLSIHKSKGLEYPICIVGAVDTTFNERDYHKTFVTDIDMGIGAEFIDPVRRIKRDTVLRSAIVDKMRRENLGEEIRVLYVALTRAKEKLIIIGGIKKSDEWLSKSVELRQTNSYLELIADTVINDTSVRESITEDDSIGDSILAGMCSQPEVSEANCLDISEDCSTGVYEGKLFRLAIQELREVESEALTEETDRNLERKALELGSDNADAKIYKELKERFDFKYPYENLSKLYTKTSVSDLKLAHIEEEEALHPFEENEPHEYVPAFIDGETEVKGTRRGTAYHNMLQQIPFEKIHDCEDVFAFYDEVKAHVLNSGRMPEEDVSIINGGKIVSFLKTDLAERMSEAAKRGELFKEQPFVIGINANEIDETFPESETILIQGVIDAFFIEDGEVVLLDYKTDRVETPDELVTRYKLQLDYYATAISRITGLNVKEKVIYSLRLNQSMMLQ